MQIQNKQPPLALITGGSSGIGKALAKLLLQSGYGVIMFARRKAMLDEAAEQLQVFKKDDSQIIAGYTVDVSNKAAVDHLSLEIISEYGCPDLLITCAGFCEPGLFLEQEMSVHEKTFQSNYFGTLYVINAFANAMVGRGQGKICLISSGAGLYGIYGYSTYSPGKAALKSLAEVLDSELSSQGIQVSIVFPPDTDTPQLAAENLTKPAVTKSLTQTAKVMSADEVAQAILKGIHKKSFIINPGEMKYLFFVTNPIYRLFRFGIKQMISKAQKQSAR